MTDPDRDRKYVPTMVTERLEELPECATCDRKIDEDSEFKQCRVCRALEDSDEF